MVKTALIRAKISRLAKICAEGRCRLKKEREASANVKVQVCVLYQMDRSMWGSLKIINKFSDLWRVLTSRYPRRTNEQSSSSMSQYMRLNHYITFIPDTAVTSVKLG